MPTLERLVELRDEALADDLDIDDTMLAWSEAEAVAFFESGGTIVPAEKAGAAAAEAAEAAEEEAEAHMDLSIKQLRAALANASVSTEDCVTKLETPAPALPISPPETPAPTLPMSPPPVSQPQPQAPTADTVSCDALLKLTARELKQMLTAHGISVDGCCERADFLSLAQEHYGRLHGHGVETSASPAGSSQVRDQRLDQSAAQARRDALNKLAESQIASERQEREERAREREERLAAQEREAKLPSYIPGVRKSSATPTALSREAGYQVDIMGAKRGACRKDSRCSRFEPPPPTPGNVLGGLICQRIVANGTRCGHHANDHDHLGHLQPGEPDLVDEKGRAFKIRMLGGGGAHDAPELKIEPMPDYKYVPVPQTTTAAVATSTSATGPVHGRPPSKPPMRAKPKALPPGQLPDVQDVD